MAEKTCGGTSLTSRRSASPSASPGTFSNDGDTISGRWEICHDGTTREHDFDLTYRRA
jgi:hypothetical protein